jgi:transposase
VTRIGEEGCEKLGIIPAQVRVRRHVRPKYACKACEGSGDEQNPAVRIAPAVKQLLPKSIASPALIAYMLVAKFCDALPFYRQERQFQRMGVDLRRQDMANWTVRVYQRIEPLVQLLRQQIRSGPVVGIDETTVQVMNEPGRANTSQSYIWVFVGGESEHPVVDYQYHPTRSGSVPLHYLQEYRGTIQTDGYDGYRELGRQPGIVHSGCRAHARREEVTPVLEKLRLWPESRQPQVPPSTLLGKAIRYAVEEWPKLLRYLDSPHLRPDNNACEREIRPFVIGRNWQISGTPAGATDSAAWYSIIQASKLNGVEPYLYLRCLLSRLPESTDPDDYRALLPWNINKSLLLDFDSGHLF